MWWRRREKEIAHGRSFPLSSGPSRQMSDPEWFAQVAQRKWANEQFAEKFWQKKSKILFLVHMFYVYTILKFFIEKWVNRSFLLISSVLVSDASVSLTIAHFLWVMLVNRSGRSHGSEEIGHYSMRPIRYIFMSPIKKKFCEFGHARATKFLFF